MGDRRASVGAGHTALDLDVATGVRDFRHDERAVFVLRVEGAANSYGWSTPQWPVTCRGFAHFVTGRRHGTG